MDLVPPLKKTALNATHRELGARMVGFAGWEMPVQYAGPIPEHLAVRTRAGIFDVSHMGELEIKGPGAERTVQHLTCNDISRLAVFQCQYSALTTPKGTFIDDLLVYRFSADSFFLCVNASNQERDYEWIRDEASANVEVLFRSDQFAQMAVQGPLAMPILQPLTGIDLAHMKYYWFARDKFAGVDAIVSRTGYTGEDGFEIYCDPSRAEMVWHQIMDSGRPHGLQPAGLAARNTLRLESRMLLYGNDINETTTVLEAGLEWICRFDKGDFTGRAELLAQRERGVERILAGFEMIDRGVARDGYPVQLDGQYTGTVTSASHAPFLKKNIGLTYLPTNRSKVGTEFNVVIRGKAAKARVVPTPFYKRIKSV